MNPALKDRIAKSYHAIDIGYTPEIVAQLAANNAHASIRYYAIPDGLFYPWLTGQKIEFRDES